MTPTESPKPSDLDYVDANKVWKELSDKAFLNQDIHIIAQAFAEVRADERLAVSEELNAAAKHFLNSKGNLSQKERSWSHDTALQLSSCVEHGIFRDRSKESA